MDPSRLVAALRNRAVDPHRATSMREFHHLHNMRGRKHSPLAAELTSDEVVAAERRLGFTLPPLLCRCYIEIGNGGFGPGYGIYGLDQPTGDEKENFAIGLYEIYVSPDKTDEYSEFNWPNGLLPICHWGCGMYSCANCLSRYGSIYRFEFDADNPKSGDRPLYSSHFELESRSLKKWLEQWVSGTLRC